MGSTTGAGASWGAAGARTVFLSAGEAAFLLPAPEGGSLKGGQLFALKMKVVGADEASDFAGEEVLGGRINYLKGTEGATPSCSS